MKKEINPITSSIDVLWTITIFYAFYQLNELRGYWPILLGILTTLLLINEWFSVRATFDFYSGPMFIADICDVFLYIFTFSKLKVSGAFPYSIDYWLGLSLIWFVYFVWDVSVLPFTKDVESAKSLKRWTFGMFFASLFTFISYLLYTYLEKNQILGNYGIFLSVLQYVDASLIVLVLIAWNRKKLETIQNALIKSSRPNKSK